MKRLTKASLKKFRQLFLDKKEEILSKLSDYTAVPDDGDEVDAAQAVMMNSMLEKLSMREKQLIRNISEALKRVEDGTYGLCEECEEQIPENRLLAIPYATLCISCAENAENMKKQYKLSS